MDITLTRIAQGYDDGIDLFYDWFCEDRALKNRGKKLLGNVRAISKTTKVNHDTTYVWFKNNCLLSGWLYDDFRFAEIETGDVIFTVIPPHHGRVNGEIWGRENNFKEPLLKNVTWKEIKQYFLS